MKKQITKEQRQRYNESERLRRLDPEYVAKINLARKKKYAENKEYRETARKRAKETKDRLKKENPELYAQKVKEAREKQKESGLSRTLGQNYRARKRKAFIESVNFKKVYERDKGICHICGTKTVKNYRKDQVQPSNYATLDHVIPLAKGGLHCYDNVKIACKSCNSSKGDRIPREGIQMDLFAQVGVRQKEKSETIDLPPDERRKAYARKYNEKNRELINAKTRERRAKMKAEGIKEKRPSREKMIEYSSSYRERKRDEINARRRQNRLAKKEKKL
jgi:hypothetical protein